MNVQRPMQNSSRDTTK